jgi:hypothetical protein
VSIHDDDDRDIAAPLLDSDGDEQQVRPAYSDAKQLNRNGRGFGWEIAHAAVTTRWYPVPGATRTTLGFGICPSFKAIFCRPVPNSKVTIRNFCIAVQESAAERRSRDAEGAHGKGRQFKKNQGGGGDSKRRKTASRRYDDDVDFSAKKSGGGGGASHSPEVPSAYSEWRGNSHPRADRNIVHHPTARCGARYGARMEAPLFCLVTG